MAQIPRRAARKHAASSRFHNACLPRPPAARILGRFGAAVVFMAALLLTPLFAHADIIHVDASAAGADNGTSWTDAYTDLQDALGVAQSGDEIWVAAGLYKPVEPADTNSVTEAERQATFQLIDGVQIFGGFAGGETALEQRDWQTNLTVLSGDIDNNDITDANGVVVDADDIVGSNSFHVVTGSGTNATTILDGFVITAGLADGSNQDNRGAGMYSNSGSPMLANVSFIGNRAVTHGGGMFNVNSSSPALTNVRFSGNRSNSDGGGMYNLNNSNPIVTNVVFSGNRAVSGGGMYNFGSDPTLTNVKFSGNQADSNGGGMFNQNGSLPTLTNVSFSGNRADSDGGGMFNINISNPALANTIIWNNQAGGDSDSPSASIFNSSSTPSIAWSLVANCNPVGAWNSSCGSDGDNNLPDADPLFIDTPDPADAPTAAGNLRLSAGSPAIDAGNDAYIDDIDNATDLDGNPRKVGDSVDLGPYEYLPDLLFHDRFEAEIM